MSQHLSQPLRQRMFSASQSYTGISEKNDGIDKAYPEVKQRGFYSDFICNANDAFVDSQKHLERSLVKHDTLLDVMTEKHTPNVSSMQLTRPQMDSDLHIHSCSNGKKLLDNLDFPLQAFQPKVQLAFHTTPGNCPRKVEIERRRRHFAQLDLSLLLQSHNIDTNMLLPHSLSAVDVLKRDPRSPLQFPPFLPLHIFDNEDRDIRTTEEWIHMGICDGTCNPVPGLALLPVLQDKDSCEWFEVGVLDYNKSTKNYLVEKLSHANRIMECDGNTAITGGTHDDGKSLCFASQFWIPRIQLMFKAEDPRIFAERIAEAYKNRELCEAELRYHLYIDCMPMDGIGELDQSSLRRMLDWALSTPGLCKHASNLDDYVQVLEREVNIDFCRSMNRIIFDRTVQDDPKTFTFVKVPNMSVQQAPFCGSCTDVPHYPFDEQYDSFAFNSLLTLPESIQAISKVRTECNRVCHTMSLFHVPTAKPMRLDEFTQVQSQATSQVALFLKDSWISTLRASIRMCLRDVGKGWFNMHETNWEVYEISKLKKFMESVKFIMQDSLRFLVQDSLCNFTHILLDGCQLMMSLDKYFIWGPNIMQSHFKPKRNALFLLDLVMDNKGVHYSTPLQSFESTLIMLFDKGIMSTYNVPQLEKYILENIFWSDTPLLEAVGEHEPAVEELRDAVKNAIQKALIPLEAYAHEYERYLDLMNIDIHQYVKHYEGHGHTASEVKSEVEMHLKEKEVLENHIPSHLVIGPFFVNTESTRQALCNKRKALSNAVLELLARQLRRQVDEASEQSKSIIRRLYEKPNCIEELSEMKEWMKTIPDKLKEHQVLIDKAMQDYEMIEEFFYDLSTDDFNAKWTAIGWPRNIGKQMEQTEIQLAEDTERFHKLQLSDQATFEDRLDTLQIVVAGMAAHSDIYRGNEIANEMRRVNKQLREAQAISDIYNNRERLFGMAVTNYGKLTKLIKDFEPYRNLWITTSDWLRWQESWMNDPLTSINAEDVEQNIIEAYKTMQKSVKIFSNIQNVQDVAIEIKGMIDTFRPYIPLIQGLRNPGMRNRHWEKHTMLCIMAHVCCAFNHGQLSEELGYSIRPKANLTFSKCLEMNLHEHIGVISKVAEIAGKEYSIEQALDKMENEWHPVQFDVLPYKETGTYIVKSSEDTNQLLDDHIVMTQSMSFSQYKIPFEDRISHWESKLLTTQDVLDEWLSCQKAWLYLESIFSSDDINRQLPVESKRYQTMERIWRKVMMSAIDCPQVITLCPDNRLLENLHECNKLLEQVQKGLSEYLETKRNAFPRFYFLSDDELLEILSQTKDPTAVQPHLHKCFENIARLQFEDDLKISKMYSAEGECVNYCESLYPTGNVEDWMSEIERVMKESLRLIIEDSLYDYKLCQRTEWVLRWPGQVIIAVCQTYWSIEVTEAIGNGSLRDRYSILLEQLDNLRGLVHKDISRIGHLTLSALIVIEVHARDVVANMVKEEVTSTNAFEWISQLRYYWLEDKNLYQRAVNAQFPYAYEYLGNTSRLVITPLTDRCYLTLIGALHLKFGGAPAGPAGTGKTETTKDLAKAFGIQCVVFNCSDQLDFMAMGKFFKGLSSCGAWACFDEFNRIDIEVLSVVAQQITTIQKAQQQQLTRFIFEGVEIILKPSCAVFITMNPGYAGRTELPDNLKALFRPVAMMVPDYALIAEISLFSFGFFDAKNLAKKIVTTFKLSSEQLSAQDHYDFGMRAVKSVISSAGNLKRQSPDMDEELIVLRAIRDVNVPKFLSEDLKLFSGIVCDLFPNMKEQPIDYGALKTSLRKCCLKMGLKDIEGFIMKCIQLYETTVVRHGLMLVGPTMSGKTRCYEILQQAQSALKGEMSPSGEIFENTVTYIVYPKSITMGQLYGEFDSMTHEWSDGILSSLIRVGATVGNSDKRWYLFDGPVDAVWIENMNTVLDDNKKLCLSSGEIIKLADTMTMMFEVADLMVASPATVSRCGMVYLEPSYIGLQAFVECWLKRLPDNIYVYKDIFKDLFNFFMEPAIKFLRENIREIVDTVDGQLVFSLLNMLECFFTPFVYKEGEKAVKDERMSQIGELIEPWFFFALIWSIGATCDNDGRVKMSEWLRKQMREMECRLQFPEEGLVYDYMLDDASISVSSNNDIEDDVSNKQIHWKTWMHGLPPFEMSPDKRTSNVLVPTIDTVRTSYVLGLLLSCKKTVLCVGPTGTGKSMTITDKLSTNMSKAFISEFMTFSAKTSANQTQDFIDGRLDKRRKGIFGPPLGKYLIFFIDDLNMPAKEVFGAQPPIELLRQWMDINGWYDRKAIGDFRHLVDINFVSAMGPPGGGRNQVTARLLRHFNFLALTEMEDQSKRTIFSTILKSWIYESPNISSSCERLVETCIATYNTVRTQLLPTPAKCHYTFNLRDLSKVVQGILMGCPEKITSTKALMGLWYHESCRVYQDRLVSVDDRTWFDNLLAEKMVSDFGMRVEDVVTQQPYIFGDFLSSNMDNRLYVHIEDHEKLSKVVEDFLDDYNQVNMPPMNLVLFMDAIKHLCRIARIIRQPLGNALLLGMGGSGRQSLTRLSAYMSDFVCFQIELSKNYGYTEWREDLRSIMMKAGLENKSTVFLFSDTQIKNESFLEDINNILNSGDVPNIYGIDEQELIFSTLKPVLLDIGLQPTKMNLFNEYKRRVRLNLHTVITMSPIGEVFRSRLRQFPALVNCCTIDWFSEWPPDALESVATRFLNDIPDLDCTKVVFNGLVAMCQEIHQTVITYSERFLMELSRYNYVTPTSYLELLGLFSSLMNTKKSELNGAQRRLEIGLDKLHSTSEEVAKLQEELATMRPLLEDAIKEASSTMDNISKDTVIAEDTKLVVQTEEAAASKKTIETQSIADDAQRDLNEALPALDAALASLKSLNKNDVVEVRALNRPPEGVRLVIDAVSIMRGVKPKKIAGEKLGQKVDDYWECGKALMVDPSKFLDSLFKYDKDNISDEIIKKIQPYIDDDAFQPAAISKVSKACTSICQWVRAMHKYHFVVKAVTPKRIALKQAQADLAETQHVLDLAKLRLVEVEEGIAVLQAKYDDCMIKKYDVENKCVECEARLSRADKLIGDLANEKDRWRLSVKSLAKTIANIVGDVFISSASIAYLGPFTGEYRHAMVKHWVAELDAHEIPRTDDPYLVATMSDPVKIRNWQIFGLPMDVLSVENGVINEFTRRWPLFIDPQCQANKWIKNMEKNNGLDVIKLGDKEFLRSLENAVRFGKPCLLENIATDIDPALEPVLLQQTFTQQGSLVIKLGDAIIPYHSDFKFYMTTKLPNPHYTPEISTKVTVVNFTLSPSGLEDQLLGIVVAEERPDLEDAKNQLIVSNAKMKQELKEIEDHILLRLSSSEGSPVDDLDLIKILEASKVKSLEIMAKVTVAEQTEKDIDATRFQYIPVAINTQILFFCVADLAFIDPMYQYSLEWFVSIFLGSIAHAERTDNIAQRIISINDNFTFCLYSNICRSLFVKHKLIFAFLLSVRINMHRGIINMDEWRHFVAGGTQHILAKDNPEPGWISDRSWSEIISLSSLPNFTQFVDDFPKYLDCMKSIFDSNEPHREALPGHWDIDLDQFQKILVLKALRLDKVGNAMQDYVASCLGQQFIEPQAVDLAAVFKESSPTIPLIFVLSTGTDPAVDLYKFSEEMKFSKKLTAISLGQGQGPRAEMLMKSAMERGKWLFFQNCHLSPSWMPTLERLVEQIDPEKVHRDFRLWLTSMPSVSFPVFILQNGSKMTVEPPKGIKANLLKSYVSFNDNFLNSCEEKGAEFKHLLLSLCIFHGVLLERRKFGALGFNIPYEFTDGDLKICINQLKIFLLEYSHVQYKVLQYTAGHINYGGRVTDDWDRRCLMNILADYYMADVLNEGHSYCDSNTLHQISTATDHHGYIEFIKILPINDTPEMFGMHDNANITFAQNETIYMLGCLLNLQPKTLTGEEKSHDEVVETTAKGIIKQLPVAVNLNDVMTKYPVLYEQSMNTVLVQEVIRYNHLLNVIHKSLEDLVNVLKGLVVMSGDLENMANSLYDNIVPEIWAKKAYPSLKPLASWTLDLIQRMSFIQDWIENGIPNVIWISGFFFPQAFLTGILQNFARTKVISIDTITFDFKVMQKPHDNLMCSPRDGCYIHGLFIEGAQWDNANNIIIDSRPKELFKDMPPIWLIPAMNRSVPQTGIYDCPVYKTLTRAGTLSTTGHSTNFVFSIELPTNRTQQHWIKRGVAMITALDY